MTLALDLILDSIIVVVIVGMLAWAILGSRPWRRLEPVRQARPVPRPPRDTSRTRAPRARAMTSVGEPSRADA